MPVFSNHVVMSKTFFLSGSVAIGSGTIYILYCMYTASKQLKRLNFQMTILADRLLRAEADILKLRLHAEQNVVSDDAEDEFEDANDEDEETGVQLVSGSMKSPSVKNGSVNLDELLCSLDAKIHEGGMTNLNYAFECLNNLSKLHSHDAEVYWRIARVHFLLAEEELVQPEHVPDHHKELMSQAQDAAGRAKRLNPTCGNAYKWLAITIGSVTQYMSMQDQIKNAYVMKEHIDNGIRYSPSDALLYYMLGRWCYSVYMLSWVERKLASALFASPPTATLEEAIEHLLKAESLEPLFSIQNQLYLAKCFIAKRDYKKAVKHMEAGKGLKCPKSDDKQAAVEIEKLLKQYQYYAS